MALRVLSMGGMMAKQSQDKFDQFMFLNVVQSAANTLTFGRLALGTSIFEFAALIISRIEYELNRGLFAELLASTDEARVALTGSNSIASLVGSQPQIYDTYVVSGSNVGTAATYISYPQPVIHDFTGLQGGGLLVPAQDMFVACESVGLTNPVTANIRVYFRILKLQAADFIELVQRLRVLTT